MEWLRNTQTGNSKWWSWWLGLVIIVICYIFLGSIPLVLGAAAGVIKLDSGAGIVGATADPRQFVLLMISPLMLFVGVWVAQRLVHQRTLTQLTTTTRFRWPLVWLAMGIWFDLLVTFTLVESFIYSERYTWTFNFEKWIIFAPLVLVLIPIQAAGEELFFRGYLMQSLSRVWAKPVFLILLSGVVFMVPHLSNPEMSQAQGGRIPMALSYFLMGAGTAWLSIRDNGIERAIGMHVVNNLFAGIAVGYSGSVLGTPTFFQANVIDAWYGVITIIIGFAVLIYWPIHDKEKVQ